MADPMLILSSSAVLSPISRLCLRRRVTDNGIVKPVAARFGTVRHDDLAEGEHRDIGHASR